MDRRDRRGLARASRLQEEAREKKEIHAVVTTERRRIWGKSGIFGEDFSKFRHTKYNLLLHRSKKAPI